MSQVYKIGSGCFRYVVSFKLECSFEEAFERIEEQKEAIVKKNKKQDRGKLQVNTEKSG